MGDRFELSYEGLELMYKFNTLYITDFKDEDLEASDNPFALVLLAAKKLLLKGKNLDKRLLEQKLLIARLLYRKGVFSRKKIKAVLTFLDNYVLFAKPEMNRIFRVELDRLSGKKNTMGIIEQVAEIRAEKALKKGRKEGREEGRTEEKTQVVRRLLADKEFSIAKIASIAGVSVDFVEKVKKNTK
jgi:predicted transposase/invertase (TIGR01784 family)